MKDLILFLSLLFATQKHFECSTINQTKCLYICTKDGQEIGELPQCPQGTFAIQIGWNSSNPCEGCSGNPCDNNGVCQDISNDPSRDEKFQCICPNPSTGKKCERWGKEHNQFTTPPVGVMCQNPVNSLKACNIAAMLADSDVKPSDNHVGDGTDLPFGCISDRSTFGIHSIFWNPKGIAITADSKIRQICLAQKPSFEGLDCADNYKKISGPDSCQVKPHSKPWMVNLSKGKDSRHYCGGVLIGTKVVLTAAHCICKYTYPYFNVTVSGKECQLWKELTVTVGDHDLKDGNLSNTMTEKQVSKIEYAEPHRKYDGNILKGYDVAILVLKNPAVLTKNVRVAHLPFLDAPCPSGKEMIVSGWGKAMIWAGQTIVEVRENRFLWAVKQQCVDVNQCHAYTGDKNAVLCVTDLSNTKNMAFKGDSGGPLTITKHGKTTVYGIVSGNGGWNNTRKFDEWKRILYFRVATIDALKWIKSLMKKYEN